MHTVTPIIEESERIIREAIAHFGLKVQASQIVITIQSGSGAYGWFASNRWQNGQVKPIHEINLSAEYLKTNDALPARATISNSRRWRNGLACRSWTSRM